MNYSISEFRKNIREALNKVEAGELVTITRHDKMFKISQAGTTRPIIEGGTSFLVQTDKGGDEYNLVPPKKIESDSQANKNELPCCSKNTPCKHWVWNEATSSYMNILSNRERAVE